MGGLPLPAGTYQVRVLGVEDGPAEVMIAEGVQESLVLRLP